MQTLFLKAVRLFGIMSILPYLQVKNKIVSREKKIFLTHSVLKLINDYEESLKV